MKLSQKYYKMDVELLAAINSFSWMTDFSSQTLGFSRILHGDLCPPSKPLWSWDICLLSCLSLYCPCRDGLSFLYCLRNQSSSLLILENFILEFELLYKLLGFIYTYWGHLQPSLNAGVLSWGVELVPLMHVNRSGSPFPHKLTINSQSVSHSVWIREKKTLS